MRKRRLAVCSLIGAVALLVGSSLAFSGRGFAQKNNPQKQTAAILRSGTRTAGQTASPPPPSAKELDDAAAPLVDFNTADAGSADEGRKTKNARFDKFNLVKSEPGAGVAEVSIDAHWDGGLSDLPTEQSDLVVEGKVIASDAFLSNDRGGVYSEFTIRITDVAKSAADLAVGAGDVLTAERIGGRVRYPDGHIVRYLLAGQGAPTKGGKYLLFLSRTDHGNYRLLTAYEIRGNKVWALDGARVNRRAAGNWAFDKHNDEDYAKFKEAVGQAVKNPPHAGRDKGVTGP